MKAYLHWGFAVCRDNLSQVDPAKSPNHCSHPLAGDVSCYSEQVLRPNDKTKVKIPMGSPFMIEVVKMNNSLFEFSHLLLPNPTAPWLSQVWAFLSWEKKRMKAWLFGFKFDLTRFTGWFKYSPNMWDVISNKILENDVLNHQKTLPNSAICSTISPKFDQPSCSSSSYPLSLP